MSDQPVPLEADLASNSHSSSPVMTRGARKRLDKNEEAYPPRKQQQTMEYRVPESPANKMMLAILEEQGARQRMPIKLHRSRLLNVKLTEDDPRYAIVVRNSVESPLLALPAEIRNKIFEYTLGGQHIHILTDAYKDDPGKLDAAGVPTANGGHNNRYRRFEQIASSFYNCVYPLQSLQWRKSLTPKAQNNVGNRSDPDDVWVIEPSKAHMTMVPAVCRQIYNETKSMSYARNEFSFQDEFTMRDWINKRAPAQKRMLEVVWIELVWSQCIVYDYKFYEGLKAVRVSISTFPRNARGNPTRTLLDLRKEDLQTHLYNVAKKHGQTLQVEFVD